MIQLRVLVSLKTSVFDPQGRTTLQALRGLGLAQRLHLLMADVESYSLRSGRDRVVGYLLREEERDGDGVAEGSVSLRLPTSKGTIASRLNLTQEHFSRILSELTSAGLIQVEGRTIHIPDIGRLRRSLG